jgi:hypothetical protein
MVTFTKKHILEEIRRLSEKNGGIPVGKQRFFKLTGIKSSDWEGKIWPRWSDALIEAGLQPNKLQGPRNEDELLAILASLVRELGHFPAANEIKLRARKEPGFPWHNTFSRLGTKQELISRLYDFCLKNEMEDIAAICSAANSQLQESESITKEYSTENNDVDLAYVYLIKAGRFFKIGRTNSLGRREYELSIQLPESPKVIHTIKTDDPAGIEAYWHNRFRERRKNGEWFELTSKDVADFKRRLFM